MSEILLPSVREQKRLISMVSWSGYEGPHRWRWECPTGCGFRVDEDLERDAQQAANAHECVAGWCAIPATHASQPSVLVDLFQVTPEDRARWARDRELKDLAKARAKAKPRL